MMITEEDVLIMLYENCYQYVARDECGYLFAYKEKPDLEDGVYFCDTNLDTDLDIDYFDGDFFKKYVGAGLMEVIDDLLDEYRDYCTKCKKNNEEMLKNDENADSDFVKFLKDEMNRIIELFRRKNKAYGEEGDVFHNFRQSARRIYNDESVNSMFMIAETLKDKHNVALAKGADVPECAERLRDNIVYSLIQLAMLKEI